MASFQEQYGIRLSRELKTIQWEEFKKFLIGISPDTALGRIVQIRAEDDPEIIKHFNSGQKRIWNEWQDRTAKARTPEETMAYLEEIKRQFIAMAGGVV